MVLLERDFHLKTLRAALNEAAREGRIALVYGEAGIGKTSLVEHFQNEYKTKWRILHGACDSLFTPRPLGPLYDIASQSQGNLSALLDSDSSRTALFSACLNELQIQKTILFIEDVHWADEATLDLLKYLGRRIRQTISLMILTYRDDEIGADHPLRILLGDLAPSHTLHRIPVPPLSKDAVRELAQGKNVDALELHRLTNGNPFYVTEVLAGEGGIPVTVRDAVLARAARLSAAALAVLEAAAVIGSRAGAGLLSKLTGEDFANVEECVSKGALQPQGDYYAFRHELARQTILESISHQRKMALHRLTLDTLKESALTRDTLTRLAYHAVALNDHKAVLEFAPLAGWWASKLGAHREAVAHYKTVLPYANMLTAEKRAELFDSYSDECDLTDQMIEARQAQQEALRLWRELGQREKEGRALRRLSEIAFKMAEKDEMDRYLEEAITVLEMFPESMELAITYGNKTRLHTQGYQAAETVYWGTKAMKLAERLGNNETLMDAQISIGYMEMMAGKRSEGQISIEHCLQLSLESGFHIQAARAFNNLGNGSAYLHDYTAAQHYFDEGLVYCTQHDLDFWRAVLIGDRGKVLLEEGHWVEAERDSHASQKLWPVPLEEALRVLLRLRVRRGTPISLETLQETRKLVSKSPIFDFPCHIAASLAEAAWLEGDLERCRTEAEPIFQVALERDISNNIGELAYWLWRAGIIIAPPPNAAESYAVQITGDWQTAASMWEKFGCPYEQGMALMDGDEAAQLKALEIFESLGARPIIEKLKRQMQSQNIRIPRGPRPATQKNPYGLTPREMEVLGQLVKGQGNEAIAEQLTISIRTVEHHVASILQKLGVASRNEAVTLAMKENLLAPGQ